MCAPENSGWFLKEDGSYEIDWEDPKKQESIMTNIKFLLYGCSCKTGCGSARCSCRKKIHIVDIGANNDASTYQLSKINRYNITVYQKVRLTVVVQKTKVITDVQNLPWILMLTI